MKSCRRRLLVVIVGVLAATGGANAQAKFPPDSDNAALRYWAALTEMRDKVGDDTTQELLSATLKGEIPWDENKLGPILDANAGALQAMQRGAKLPECVWGLDYRLGVSTPAHMLMRARSLERLNTVEGIRELAKGNGEAAVNTWLAGIRFSQDVGRGGPVIVAMVGSAMLTDILPAITAQARQGKLRPAQKKALYEAIQQLPEDGFDWGIAWGVEYAIADQFLHQLQTSSDPKAIYEKYGYDAPKGLPPTVDELRAYEEYMLAAQAALREPVSKARARADDLESKMRRLAEPELLLATDFSQSNDARARVATQREELVRALASN